MAPEELILNRAVVVTSALLYWGGVLLQARRVRRHIGKSPNLKPRGAKERLLWAGWMVVILGWMTQAFVIGRVEGSWLQLMSGLATPTGTALGIGFAVLGYAGTWWCYAAMGDRWRIGIDRKEKVALVESGPYRFVRHPIYLFQMVMLAGAFLLLPAALSLALVGLHWILVLIKAADEEAHFLTTQRDDYRQYLSRTGKLFPKLLRSTPRLQ